MLRRRDLAPHLWAVVLMLAAREPAAAPPTERIYDVTSTRDRTELARHLRRYVAYVTVEVARAPGQPLSEPARTGYAVPWTANRLAVLCFLVENARSVRVQGPDGGLSAEVILYDIEHRVAILETPAPLARIGLAPVTPVGTAELRVGETVFALVSTLPNAGVVDGVVTEIGRAPELEGHPRIDLVLTHGMPVFDARARFVGYARAVGWDRDRRMLVPPDKVTGAQTATSARGVPPSSKARPWWGR